MADATAQTVQDLARPLVDEAGLDLVDVEVKGSGSRTRVRVIVDRKGGVDVGACQQLSRALEKRLEAQDPVPGRYTLEVTSPGTDRPLVGQRAFDRVEGRTIKLILPKDPTEDAPSTDPPTDGTIQLVGDVVEAREDAVVLQDAEGDRHEVGYEQIIKATQVLPW